MVDVAQLVEPRIVIPVVAGSIPVVHPILTLFLSIAYPGHQHSLTKILLLTDDLIDHCIYCLSRVGLVNRPYLLCGFPIEYFLMTIGTTCLT